MEGSLGGGGVLIHHFVGNRVGRVINLKKILEFINYFFLGQSAK